MGQYRWMDIRHVKQQFQRRDLRQLYPAGVYAWVPVLLCMEGTGYKQIYMQ